MATGGTSPSRLRPTAPETETPASGAAPPLRTVSTSSTIDRTAERGRHRGPTRCVGLELGP